MKNVRSDLIFVATVVTWKVSSPLICAMILQICGISSQIWSWTCISNTVYVP